MKNFWGQKNEGRKDVPGADALQGVHRRGLQDEQGQVCQSSHAKPLELLSGRLGDEGRVVIETIFTIFAIGFLGIALAIGGVCIMVWLALNED